MDYRKLSKTISRALRHAPADFGLALDEEGWTPVADLLTALARMRHQWQHLTEADLRAMMAQAAKQRYELRDGRIRALYGHSISQRIQKEPTPPPALLYHGTAPETAVIILREGLKPMRRQYVHLSQDVETARIVGRRKAAHPVILTLDAAAAAAGGVLFYRENNGIWLADFVPPDFIHLLSSP